MGFLGVLLLPVVLQEEIPLHRGISQYPLTFTYQFLWNTDTKLKTLTLNPQWGWNVYGHNSPEPPESHLLKFLLMLLPPRQVKLE